MTTIASGMAKLLRILCAVALLSVGFAHRPVTPVVQPDLAAYTLPDGTVPQLCLSSPDDHGHHPHPDAGRGCDACRLSAAILLPSPNGTASVPMTLAGDAPLPRRRDIAPHRPFSPNTAPRGPPALS